MAGSAAIVRAPAAVGTVSVVVKWPGAVSRTTLIVPSWPLALKAAPSIQATPSEPAPMGGRPSTLPSGATITICLFSQTA